MKDIPMFTTEHGVAGLTLQEIPYNKKAFITIHDTRELQKLLQECVDFCKAVGAEAVYACGHEGLTAYPVYTQIVEMECVTKDLPHTRAEALPAKDTERFTVLYNQKMANVPASAYLSRRQAQKLAEQGSCWFIYRDEECIGLGVTEKGALLAVASFVPGGGKDAVVALCRALNTDRVRLEVAVENQKAMTLYEKLGFVVSGRKNTWYKIF